MNTGEPWPSLDEALPRVLGMQAKLHLWAVRDPGRRFDDLYNLVCDPAFLVVAWDRVRRNKGARTAGVDGVSPRSIVAEGDVAGFLADARAQLKARVFTPLPVRERLIPKGSPGKFRSLGIPSAMDRLVQASVKLVLEPIFEADFKPVSYGFRPRRRAQDAIAEIHHFGTQGYHWVLEADIEACFDEISHPELVRRVRARIGDKRVLVLVKSFLKAGIMAEGGQVRDSVTGTPQGGILSPLLANIALSALDEHICAGYDAHGTSWRRSAHRRRGGATHRIVRYADDFVIMVHGSRAHAEALREEVARVLAPLGLRLSAAKTRVCHLDEGLDFLGFRIQRRVREARPGSTSTPTRRRRRWPPSSGRAGADTRVTAPDARRPAPAGQRSTAWMVQLLPVRRVQGHVPLCGYVHVAAHHAVAAQTTQRDQLEDPLPRSPPRSGTRQPRETWRCSGRRR